MDVLAPRRRKRPSSNPVRAAPLALTLLAFAAAAPARAGDTYIETGFGVGMMRQAGDLFASPLSSVSELGAAINLSFFWNLSDDYSSFQVHLGLKDRISTANSGALQFALNVPYPTVRLEISHLYLGAGVSPFVYTRQGSLFSTSYERRQGTLAYMGEVGLLWKVVPFFHLSIELGATYVSHVNPSMSPAPAVDATVNMRFFLGTSGKRDGSGGGSGREFDGWRYPFGIEIN